MVQVAPSTAYLFQSDAQAATQAARDARKANTAGSPVFFSGKIICCCESDGRLYVGLSNHAIGAVDIQAWKKTPVELEGDDPFKGPVSAICFWDAETMITGCWDMKIRVYRRSSGQTERWLLVQTAAEHRDYVKSFAVSRATGELFSGCCSGDLHRWGIEGSRDAPNRPPLLTHRQSAVGLHDRSIEALLVHSSQRLLVSLSSDNTLQTIDGATLQTLNRFRHHATSVYCGFLADSVVYSGSADHTVQALDLESGSVCDTIGFGAWVRALCAAEACVAAGLDDGRICVVDATSGTRLLLLEGHFDQVSWLGCSRAAPGALISASLDGSVRHWALPCTAAAAFSQPTPALCTAEEDEELAQLLADG